jgi:hypothetical protein
VMHFAVCPPRSWRRVERLAIGHFAPDSVSRSDTADPGRCRGPRDHLTGELPQWNQAPSGICRPVPLRPGLNCSLRPWPGWSCHAIQWFDSLLNHWPASHPACGRVSSPPRCAVCPPRSWRRVERPTIGRFAPGSVSRSDTADPGRCRVAAHSGSRRTPIFCCRGCRITGAGAIP